MLALNQLSKNYAGVHYVEKKESLLRVYDMRSVLAGKSFDLNSSKFKVYKKLEGEIYSIFVETNKQLIMIGKGTM